MTVKNLDEYKMTNREKRLQPRKNTFWCDHCDMQIVTEWKKCPVCGNRNGSRRLKKYVSS